ncbi:MAG: hypothetical protein RL181_836 [Bacteroidota bacterium]|jgi:hypothetical protein
MLVQQCVCKIEELFDIFRDEMHLKSRIVVL